MAGARARGPACRTLLPRRAPKTSTHAAPSAPATQLDACPRPLPAGRLHLEGSPKATKLKLTWLADLGAAQLTPLRLLDFDYLIK